MFKNTFSELTRFLMKVWVSPYIGKNDNRNYMYEEGSFSEREEFKIIARMVRRKAKVLDLGCGDGSLLKILKDKGAIVEGIEISESGVKSCIKKGLKVRMRRIDEKLPYRNKEFDIAICNVTLQMVMYPEILITEMKRIAKKQIFTFPNFAFLPNRIDLLLNGRMPIIMIPGYEWFSTGHIHQLSIADFESFCNKNNLTIIANRHVYPGSSFRLTQRYVVGSKFMRKHPNLFASMAIFLTTSKA